VSKSKTCDLFFVIYILSFLREIKEAKEIFEKLFEKKNLNLDQEKTAESGSPGPPAVNCKTGEWK